MHRALPPLALAFGVGAAFGLAFQLPEAAALALAVAFCLGVFLARERPVAGVALALGLAAALGLLRASSWLRLPADSVARLSDRRWARLHGTVVGELERRPWGSWFDMAVDRADTRREPVTVSGRVRVYVRDGPGGTGLPLRYGQRVAAEGRVTLPDEAANPGEIPPVQYLRREGIVATLSARALAIEPGCGGSWVVALALRSRHALERGISATLPVRHAGLLRGLLFSDTAALPEGAREDFARSGTVHILSTSGVHVALLSALVAFLFPARRPSARRARSLLLLCALLFFALMTGLRPAVVRAVLMTGAALAAPLFDREPDAWCALGLAALALVAAAPGNLLDPGFQLSFAAAVALALWFTRKREPVSGLARLPRSARVSMEASTVATLATWPLAARYFGTLSLAAPLTNLLVIPLVAPAMALGLVQGLLWPVAPALAKAAGAANAVVLGAILGVTSVVARWPWSAVDVTPPGTAAVVASLALLFALLALRRRPSLARRLSPALVPAGASAVALYLAWRAFWPVPLTVTFLDVGQGDAILLQTPGGRSVLVDAGGRYEDPREARKHGVALSGRDVGERVVVPALRRAGVRRLDVLVLTHPHEDHAGGLPAVMAAFPVALWLDGGGTHPSPGYREALHMAGTARTPRHLARAGERLALGDGVSLEILAPDPERPPGSEERLNDTSLVCRVVYGRTSLLLSGDAETAEETSLLRSGADLRADLVKVGHHGGSSSAGEAFLAAVRPAIAVISCGRNNRYGHPADQMLLRAAAAGAHVYRTDVDGAVVITSDGRRLRVRTSRWFMP